MKILRGPDTSRPNVAYGKIGDAGEDAVTAGNSVFSLAAAGGAAAKAITSKDPLMRVLWGGAAVAVLWWTFGKGWQSITPTSGLGSYLTMGRRSP